MPGRFGLLFASSLSDQKTEGEPLVEVGGEPPVSDQRPPVLTKAAKKSVSKPAKKVAGAAIGEGVDDNKKRGRPEKWTPRVMEPADFVRASELRKKYGPDMEPLARFAKKYEIFCALNKIEKSDGIFLAMGQASEMGAAASSMNTQFGGMLKQRLFACANSWEARETLERHHADANPVQPRSFVGTQENLSALVEKMDVIMTKALAWMCFVTGARAITITRLRYSQTILMKSALLLQRRWSKVCRTRSKRDTLSYKYAWSMPPPEDVVSFFDKGKKTTEPRQIKFTNAKYASHFRDLLEWRLLEECIQNKATHKNTAIQAKRQLSVPFPCPSGFLVPGQYFALCWRYADESTTHWWCGSLLKSTG